jgi:hypothetical protein
MLTRVNSQKRKVNVRALPVLDFNQYVGEYGQITIEMDTHLSAESAVKVFSFKNKPVSLPTFEQVVAHYFKPWHFDYLVRIDIVGKFARFMACRSSFVQQACIIKGASLHHSLRQ